MITIILDKDPSKAKFYDTDGNDITSELHVQKVSIEQDAQGQLQATVTLLPEKVVAMQPDLRAELGVKLPQRGGVVKPGRSFIVGEKGPENFTPKRTGIIRPRTTD